MNDPTAHRFFNRPSVGLGVSIGVAFVALLAVASPPTVVAAEQPLVVDPVLLEAEEQRIEAIARATPSTVCVFVPGGGGGGSGVLISADGYALTNFHVTSPAGAYLRCGLSDGNVYDAVIVGIDPVGDLAMIRLLGRDDFPFAELADSSRAEVGDWCMVIGNPFLLASNLQPTVTWGILSGVGRYQYPSGTLLEYADCLQTDASINPGNSGGPIYDASGKLLGIVGRASFEKRGRVNVGVGYAISINQAKNFLGYLRSGRIVDHATLGATVATDPEGGARVTNILENSDAYRRGLRYSCEILEVDSRGVQTANDLQNVLATLPSRWRVKMSFRHEGKTIDTLVRLMSVHREDELLKKMADALPPPPPRPQKNRPKKPTPQKLRPGAPDPLEPEDRPGEKSLPQERLPKDAQPQDAPREGPNIEKPKEGKKKEHPKGSSPNAKAPDKYPKAVKALFAQRKGYANYHFNLLQQDRFLESLRQQFPGGKADDLIAWIIEGETIGEPTQAVTIRVSSGDMSISVGDVTVPLESNEQRYDSVNERSIAGILPALDAWRRMISVGPKKFGESYYLGKMPLGGERPLRDCMIGIDGDMEVRWLSHPDSQFVEAIEIFADQDSDPAEVWVIRQSSDDGAGEGADEGAEHASAEDGTATKVTNVPSQLDLRYGVDSVLRIGVKSWKLVAESETEPADAEETQ